MTDLPAHCPEHPEAFIRHTWREWHEELAGHDRIVTWSHSYDHDYCCAICGRRLAAPEKEIT